jgi:glycosyltransferase involved in cell wall biosynthesis
MLRDKGVIEFVEAAKLLRLRQIAARCVLVGAPDPANPSSLTRDQLEHWAAEGAVEWWGHRENMATTLQQFHIACLPSYREGLPKFLLEAMACGLPVVSTDVPGCREAVEPERTGRLVPPRDALALASALESLVVSEGARNRFGAAGRERVLRMFDQRLIIRETLDLYALMCPSLPRGEFQ